jgi:SHS2 domain-containing protein
MESDYIYSPEAILSVCEYEASGDLGLRVQGPDFASAIAAAVHGLVSAILPPSSVHAEETRTLSATGKDDEELVVSFLNEVLFLIYVRKWIPKRLEQLSLRNSEEIVASLVGEAYEPKRHPIDREIKAVTYHDFAITRRENEVTIEFLCDL